MEVMVAIGLVDFSVSGAYRILNGQVQGLFNVEVPGMKHLFNRWL